MIEFIYHDDFQREIDRLAKKYLNLIEGLKSFERLSQFQFDPLNPRQVIAPAKLHRVIQNDLWAIWKIELAIPYSNLRPNQFPRMWFGVKGSIIALLCIATHVDNYNDETVNRLATLRIKDIF